MKKLFTALMISGSLFVFASCGSNEPKTEEGTSTDTSSTMSSEPAPATTQSAPAADSAAAMPDTTAH